VSLPEWTLGISTSAVAEVALLQGDEAVCQAATGQTLESLLPCLQRALKTAGLKLHAIRLVAVCTGPGSFTGLRIGVAFAKSFAQSCELPVVGVSAYDVAEFGVDQLPVVALAKGKSNYYYGRVTTQAREEPEFFAGDAAHVQQILEELQRAHGRTPVIAGTDFSPLQPGERARRVAELGRRACSAGLASSWRDISIDYGQRPNAVINWESRQQRAQQGPPFESREIQNDEGPAAPA
jgi:tRNA threonylcarbamoyl adenosine modification protein YeaZ